jgi:nicotinamidase-related amidase
MIMNSNVRQNKALLIIDMQKGSFTPDTPRYDTEGVVSRINSIAEHFRSHNFPVIFIQHDGSQWDVYKPNTEEWELLDELEVKPSDLIVSKIANDSFYKSKLESILNEHNINEILITGCATDFCVESTVQSAITKDYDITIVEDAHTTGERPNISAKDVIDHYNWIWKNMIPTKGLLRVLSSENIMAIENQLT